MLPVRFVPSIPDASEIFVEIDVPITICLAPCLLIFAATSYWNPYHSDGKADVALGLLLRLGLWSTFTWFLVEHGLGGADRD